MSFISLTISVILLSNAIFPVAKAQTLSVPGLQVGTNIFFFYEGKDLARVTLSIEDNIGKSLHFELRHNEGCKGDPPQLLFNTKENGVYGTPRDLVDVTEIRNGATNFWIITAEENGYLIEQPSSSISHTFAYRSPHQLSDISKVKLYANQGCGESKNFEGWLLAGYEFSSFSKFEIQGNRLLEYNGRSSLAYFDLSDYHYFMIDKTLTGLTSTVRGDSGWLNNFCAVDSPTPLTEKTIYGIILEYSAEENEYSLTLSIDDAVKKTCKVTIEGSPVGRMYLHLLNILKFNVEE